MLSQQNGRIGSSKLFSLQRNKKASMSCQNQICQNYGKWVCSNRVNNESREKWLQSSYFYLPLPQLLTDALVVLKGPHILNESPGSRGNRVDLIHKLCTSILTCLGATLRMLTGQAFLFLLITQSPSRKAAGISWKCYEPYWHPAHTWGKRLSLKQYNRLCKA